MEHIEQRSSKMIHGGRKRFIGILVLLAAVGGGSGYWQSTRGKIETDNAFVDGDVYSIAPKIPGTVSGVHVKDGQMVRKGDLLMTLDSRDVAARVQSARAAMDLAQNQTRADSAEVVVAAAGAESAQARLLQAKKDFDRARALSDRGVIPRERFEKAETDRLVAEKQVQEAEGRLAHSRAVSGALLSKQDALIRQRAALLIESENQLSYTKIYAPVDGYIARSTAKPGEVVQAGQPLMAVVDLGKVWITANFKEKQLREMRVGQPVVFTVDAYPGLKFTGHIDHIAAGTGSAFALLPAENATGNYVKVVQRVPVRISIDMATGPKHLLRIGMSVVPIVTVEGYNGAR